MDKTYVSDVTRFLRELKQNNPELERDQREGRAIWWDKNMDPELYKRFDESTVPQPAYVYQPKVV
jgi:hypothetical protein